MSEVSIIQDSNPWDPGAGVVIDPIAKTATVTGAVTLSSHKFVITRQCEFSLFVSGTGTGAGGAWKIFAANDYDATRPVQFPGTFVDVTADFGAAGTGTAPGVHNFAAAFAGAATDRFSSWACPYGAIQFRYTQTSGTEVVSGQFFASEI
jgi:hypothetical protein